MATGTFSLTEFVQQARNNSFSRPDRFEVMIVPPPGLTDIKTLRLASVYCDQAMLPQINVGVKPFRIYGAPHQRPTGTIDYGGDSINLQFHLDRDMRIKKLFEDWLHFIVDQKTYAVNYANKYQTTMEIFQLNEMDEITYSIKLYDCFPRSIQQLQLDQGQVNVAHSMNVSFAYRRWESTLSELPKQTTSEIEKKVIETNEPRFIDPTKYTGPVAPTY